ncbi:hypothetical protein B0H13DRAFT_2524384 [Mycena leptocephala]|nr:hypothetical protein B0H13DRAFT_2524384 [Mycena leptocephala]
MLARTCTILLAAINISARSLNDPSLATVYDKCVVNNTVALTFDDGPYIYMTNVSDLLTKHNAKGTFFVRSPVTTEITRLDSMWFRGRLITQNTILTTCKEALLDVLSIKTSFLRPPYGNYNNLVRQTAKNNTKSLVVWDFELGWRNLEQSEIDYNAIIAKHPQTLLALNHETEVNTTLYLLPTVIPQLQAAGYKLVTLAECLGLEPYTFVGSFGPRDASFFPTLCCFFLNIALERDMEADFPALTSTFDHSSRHMMRPKHSKIFEMYLHQLLAIRFRSLNNCQVERNEVVRALPVVRVSEANNEKGWTVAQQRTLPTPVVQAIDDANNEKGWTVALERGLPTPI